MPRENQRRVCAPGTPGQCTRRRCVARATMRARALACEEVHESSCCRCRRSKTVFRIVGACPITIVYTHSRARNPPWEFPGAHVGSCARARLYIMICSCAIREFTVHNTQFGDGGGAKGCLYATNACARAQLRTRRRTRGVPFAQFGKPAFHTAPGRNRALLSRSVGTVSRERAEGADELANRPHIRRSAVLCNMD